MKKKKKVVKTTITEEIIENYTTNEKTHIICILDKSGSMGSIVDDTIGGFNEFLINQKNLPDEATITIALFDHSYELLYDNVDIRNVEPITRAEWSPMGTTALYDAVGKSINDAQTAHAKLEKEDKPDKVLVCIVTDGYENSSREFTKSQIENMISICEKNDWVFVYLAANQDAFAVGTGLGISGGNTYNFTASNSGAVNMTGVLNDITKTYRSMSINSVDYEKNSTNLMDSAGVKEEDE